MEQPRARRVRAEAEGPALGLPLNYVTDGLTRQGCAAGSRLEAGNQSPDRLPKSWSLVG